MTVTFDARKGLIVVEVFIAGPRGARSYDFALDTGSNRTAVSGLILEAMGYRRDQAVGRHRARTASGGLETGLVSVSRLIAFGHSFDQYPVVWLPVPPASRVVGLLGLDFLRGQRLTIDFARGRIALDAPGRRWRFWR